MSLKNDVSAMTIMGYYAALLVVCCLSCSAADQEFYRQFLSLTATATRSVEITSCSLVDTNNTGFKLTNILASPAKLRTDGELCGIRVGMTMEEVVARWGKPPKFLSRCQTRPLFSYTDVNVFFEPAANSVMAISAYNRSDGAPARPVWPSVEEWVRAFGEPTRRDDNAERTHGWLVYELTNATVRLRWADGQLNSIQLGRAVKPAAPEK